MLESSLLAFLREHAGQHNYVIAGGYVRDRLLGRQPRDIDVFVLNSRQPETDSIQANLSAAGIPTIRQPKVYRALGPRPYFGEPIELRFLEWPVQLITTSCEDATRVIDTFDYDICQFYMDNARNFEIVGDLSDRAYNAIKTRTLGLRHLLTPLSSLRRGFLFEHRLGFKFPKSDIARLVTTLSRQHEFSSGGWDE